jgi:hypothetical protein
VYADRASALRTVTGGQQKHGLAHAADADREPRPVRIAEPGALDETIQFGQFAIATSEQRRADAGAGRVWIRRWVEHACHRLSNLSKVYQPMENLDRLVSYSY